MCKEVKPSLVGASTLEPFFRRTCTTSACPNNNTAKSQPLFCSNIGYVHAPCLAATCKARFPSLLGILTGTPRLIRSSTVAAWPAKAAICAKVEPSLVLVFEIHGNVLPAYPPRWSDPSQQPSSGPIDLHYPGCSDPHAFRTRG